MLNSIQVAGKRKANDLERQCIFYDHVVVLELKTLRIPGVLCLEPWALLRLRTACTCFLLYLFMRCSTLKGRLNGSKGLLYISLILVHPAPLTSGRLPPNPFRFLRRLLSTFLGPNPVPQGLICSKQAVLQQCGIKLWKMLKSLNVTTAFRTIH